MASHYSWQGEDLLLILRVQPRASRDAIVGLHGEALKVAITAPPVEGQANDHLQRFLAREFGVANRAVQLESGRQGRNKRLRISQPQQLPAAAAIRAADVSACPTSAAPRHGTERRR